MMKLIYTDSWGGRGEHGVLEVYMGYDRGELVFEMSDKSWDDWGGSSVVQSDNTYHKRYTISGSVDKNLVQQYIKEMMSEFKITGYRREIAVKNI